MKTETVVLGVVLVGVGVLVYLYLKNPSTPKTAAQPQYVTVNNPVSNPTVAAIQGATQLGSDLITAAGG